MLDQKNGDGVSTQHIYLFIVSNKAGEKIAEYIGARVPNVGEIITLSYLDAHGKFEVLEVTPKAVMEDYEVVSLKVRPIEPENPRGNQLSWEGKSVSSLPRRRNMS